MLLDPHRRGAYSCRRHDATNSASAAPRMLCETCQQNAASVHITQLTAPPATSPDGNGQYAQKHVCEACAQKMSLLHVPIVKKIQLDIWKLVESARQSREQGGLACPSCGMTLAEFRSKGRLGCPKDYEVFREHLDPLLMRMHNALEHAGRLPGIEEEELKRQQRIHELRGRLDNAIREEDYEDAARIRDELKTLGSTEHPA
jgi:protein arginine kinase activator